MADLDLLSSYGFALPEAQIAKHPLANRSDSRLLVVVHDGNRHQRVTDLPGLLAPGDVLVVNDTTVIPARLLGKKLETGGKVECLLVRDLGEQRFVCLLGASKTPKPGNILVFGEGDATLRGTVAVPLDNEPGTHVVAFEGDALAFAERFGHIPLPPYMARGDDAADRERYQTVYRDTAKAGSAAAPTAGLHFDAALLAALDARGVKRVSVTLHVGPGTFLPVRTEKLSDHVMHPEPFWIPEATATAIAHAKANGHRVIAVGTTSLRALESSLDPAGNVIAGHGLTRIFLKPGTPVRSIDAIVTNFHLPESTLFVLVCALAGYDRMRGAYEEAIAAGYRFYSYGDASFIEVEKRGADR